MLLKMFQFSDGNGHLKINIQLCLWVLHDIFFIQESIII